MTEEKISKGVIFGIIILMTIGLFFAYPNLGSNMSFIEEDSISHSASGKIQNETKQDDVKEKTSIEYATIGGDVWKIFECAIYSADIGNKKEADRLFSFGNSQGKIFLGALRSGKIKEDDYRKNVPIGIGWNLEGPNDDFIMGRIYDEILESVADRVGFCNYYDEKDCNKNEWNSNELRKKIANNEYEKKNCKFIGKD